MSRINLHYSKVIIFDLVIQLNYTNVFQISKLKSLLLNINSSNALDLVNSNLSLFLISNQIASYSFKIHQNPLSKNLDITSFVHLKQDSCFKFLDFLIFFIYPNIQKFKGFNFNSLNKQGEFSIKLNSLLVFPQLSENYLQFNRLDHLNIHLYFSKHSALEN